MSCLADEGVGGVGGVGWAGWSLDTSIRDVAERTEADGPSGATDTADKDAEGSGEAKTKGALCFGGIEDVGRAVVSGVP
jgi:hypothetical protein